MFGPIADQNVLDCIVEIPQFVNWRAGPWTLTFRLLSSLIVMLSDNTVDITILLVLDSTVKCMITVIASCTSR